MVYMQGPIALDVADVFHKRWKYLLDEGVEYAENSSDFEVYSAVPTQPGDVEIQVTATLPTPLNENAIWESQVNAVRHAEHFIYIEDQYFRAPLLFDAIVDRMLEKQDIVLIVVTKPVNEWTDPGCRWTYESNLLFKDAVGDRYVAVQLRSFDYHVTWGIDETDAVFKDMDVHSKMLIVDDKYMSVGSCNKNNRGLLYEGELNVSILNRDFVRAAIKRIFSNLLVQAVDTVDPHELFNLVKQEAAANQEVWDRWDDEGFDLNLNGAPLPDQYKPVGFVYPLPFNPVKECAIESIGPDVMRPYQSDSE
jgi:phosphatidylserine/phosphatidylglycerophosphate/cardiolipin synthase-like enzyme